jgi:hypothetical protein
MFGNQDKSVFEFNDENLRQKILGGVNEPTTSEDSEKKLSREKFYEGVAFLLDIFTNISERNSLVFHSSTAILLLMDKVRRRKNEEPDSKELITNDIDVWTSEETIQSLINILEKKGIEFVVEKDRARLDPDKNGINVSFTYNDIDYDIWSGMRVTQDDVTEVGVSDNDGNLMLVKVTTPATLARLYARLEEYDGDHHPELLEKRKRSYSLLKKLQSLLSA